VEKKEKFSRFNGFSARVNPLKRVLSFGHRPYPAGAGAKERLIKIKCTSRNGTIESWPHNQFHPRIRRGFLCLMRSSSPGSADVLSAGGAISRNTASRRDAGASRSHNQIQPRLARDFLCRGQVNCRNVRSAKWQSWLQVFNRIGKLVRLIIPQSGILIPSRMGVISFLGGLFPRPPNYVPKNIFKSSKSDTPEEKAFSI
jgi:hypothetical protein